MPDPLLVYSWLNKFEASHLSEASRFCVDQIKTALQKGASNSARSAQVTTLINRLLNLRKTCSDPQDKAEISVECALAFYRLERYPEALACLQEVLPFYDAKWHQAAVARCLMAGIQDKTASEHDHACESLLLGVQLFARQSQYCLSAKNKDWYRDRIKQIELELDAASCPAGARDDGVEPVDDVATDELFRQLFQNAVKVHAGFFEAVEDDYFTVERVSVNQVLIDNQPYRFYNLRGTDQIVELTYKHCVMIKVVGKSMNNPSGKTSVAINDGDFVLVAKQNFAQSGDIVAAEIDDIADSLATLKRYQVLPGKILLKPESTEPAFQRPFEFTAGDPRVHIRGVAMAVCKPGT